MVENRYQWKQVEKVEKQTDKEWKMVVKQTDSSGNSCKWWKTDGAAVEAGGKVEKKQTDQEWKMVVNRRKSSGNSWKLCKNR